MIRRRDWVKASLATIVSATVTGHWVQASQLQATTHQTLHIKNLHCEGCAKRLRQALYKVQGVLTIQTNVSQGIAVITPTRSATPSAKAIWEAAENQKFQVAKLVTPTGTYSSKPQR